MTSPSPAHALASRPLARGLTACLSALLLLAAHPAAAQERTKEDWEKTREKITELRAQARQMRAEAAQQYAVAEKRCLQKFLASDCLEDARKARVALEHQASAVEREAQALDRGVKAEQHAAQMIQNQERAKQSAAEAGRRAEQARQKEEKNASRLAKKAAKEKPCPCDCPPANTGQPAR